MPQSRVRIALCRTPAQPSDSWAGWDHIAYNGVADSKKRERRERKRKKGKRKGEEERQRRGRECIRTDAIEEHGRFERM